jgi:hypothetical protein
MSDNTLNSIMCLAVTDGKFRETLLTDAANVVGDFDLEAEEQHILTAIKVDCVTDFARELHAWMVDRGGSNGHRRGYQAQQLGGMWDRRVSALGAVG